MEAEALERYAEGMLYGRWFAAATLTAALFPLFAQSDDWARVKALAKGTDVTVIQSDMKSMRGVVDGASDEEIVVAGVTVPRGRVVRISSHKSSRRVSNAVLLGVVGGLVGAGAMRFGVACAETNDGCRNSVLAAIGGAVGGAAIGALAFSDMVEVYRIPKKK